MTLGDQIVLDSPLGCFLTTGGVRGVGRTAITAYGVTGSLTVAAWVRVTSLPPEGVTADIVRFSQAAFTRSNISLSLHTTGGNTYFRWQVSNAAGAVTTTQTGTTPVAAVDRWYMVMGCKNSTFAMRLFVNGVDDAPIIVSGIAATTNASRRLSVGYDFRAINTNFDGDIASVMLWDIALSEANVKAVYNGGWRDLNLRVPHTYYTEASSLKHWWRLGQGATNESVGDRFVSDWAVSGGISLPDYFGTVNQEHVMLPGIVPSGTSALFDAADALSSPVAVPVGLSNQFSLSMWLKPQDISTAFQTLAYIGPAGPSQVNAIDISLAGTLSGDPVRVDVKSSAGASIQLVNFNNLLTLGKWQHLLVTFNSSLSPPIRVYRNGVQAVGSTEASGGAGSTDTSRYIEIGGSIHDVSPDTAFVGQIGHVGIWNSALSGEEARFLSASGHCVDLRYNNETYWSAENLKHYYKFGEDLFTKGKDFMYTQTTEFVIPLLVETGSVVIMGDTPGEGTDEVNLPPPTVFAEPTVLKFFSSGINWLLPDINATPPPTADIGELYQNTYLSGFNGATEHLVISNWHGGMDTAAPVFDTSMGRQFNPLVSGPTVRDRVFQGLQTLGTGVYLLSGGHIEFASGFTEVGLSAYKFGPQSGIMSAGSQLVIDRASLGVENQDWFRVARGSFTTPEGVTTVLPAGASLAPDIVSEEEYIVFHQMTAFFPLVSSSVYRRLQWYYTIQRPDEGPIGAQGVYTGNTTVGASAPGRGYSYANNFNGDTRRFPGVSLQTLKRGVNIFRHVAHRTGGADPGDRFSSDYLIIRRAMFQQSIVKEVATKLTTSSTTFTNTAFQLTVNSTKKVLLVFFSNSMSTSPARTTKFRLVSTGGTVIDDFGAQTMRNPYNNATAPSSDADLMPVALFHIVDNPGLQTYTIQHGLVGTAGTVTWNCRDDGTSGFKGYLMALELSLATGT